MNLVSAFSLIGFFVSLNCYFNQLPFNRILIFSSIALNGLALLFTLSLGGLIAGGAALIYLYGFKKRWALLLVLALSAFFILYGQSYTQSIADRANWWSAAFQMIIQHPFFGYGPGTFEKVGSYFFAGRLKSLYAHNFFLQMASECGLLSMTAFLLFIAYQIKNIRKSFIAGSIIALLTQNFYDFSMNIPGFFMYFWILLGLSSKAPPSADAEMTPKIKSSGVLWVIKIVLLLIILFAGWKLGIKPLLGFKKSFHAQEQFENHNLKETENLLREAVFWDPLPSKSYSDLSMILFIQEAKRSRALVQYKLKEKDSAAMEEAVQLQKQALQKEPLSILYRNRLRELSVVLKNETKR